MLGVNQGGYLYYGCGRMDSVEDFVVCLFDLFLMVDVGYVYVCFDYVFQLCFCLFQCLLDEFEGYFGLLVGVFYVYDFVVYGGGCFGYLYDIFDLDGL